MSSAQLLAVATADQQPGTMTSREIMAAPPIAPGFGSLQSFELLQRTARVLSSSTLVPAAYRQVIEKIDRFGNVTESRENPNALANSVVALNMAQRMGADPLMVMQNLYIVEGRPSWSSQWIIAAINGCGRFSPLRFDIVDLGDKTVEAISISWEGPQGNRKKVEVRTPYKIRDKKCIAWAVEKETGSRIESPSVTIEMAVKEGWYGKNGSKWQTMDEVMLRYRTASFFGKLYAPELLMGLVTVEESIDMVTLEPQEDGSYAPPSEPRGTSQAAQDLNAAARRPTKKKTADAPLTIEQQWAKYDEVLADYGPEEAENFMPSEPRPTTSTEATSDLQQQTGIGDSTIVDAEWKPSPKEQAEIARREQAEASDPGLFTEPDSKSAATNRRPRQPLGSMD